MPRQEFSLTILFDIAQLPRATFYYHLKQMQKTDKYASVKEEITAIYHENKGRYGYHDAFRRRVKDDAGRSSRNIATAPRRGFYYLDLKEWNK